MSKCSVCGNTRRAGTGGRVNLLDAAGQLRTVIACAACVGRSISIVSAGTGGRVNLLDAAGQLRTVIACAACVGRSISIVTAPPASILVKESDDADVRKVLRGLARHIRRIASAYTKSSGYDRANGEPIEGLLKRDGLEQAADIAEAWAKERGARKPVVPRLHHFVGVNRMSMEVFYAKCGEWFECQSCNMLNMGDCDHCARHGRPSDSEPNGEGWYYWFCFPGCMPDSEAFGPYETEAEAVEAMREECSE